MQLKVSQSEFSRGAKQAEDTNPEAGRGDGAPREFAPKGGRKLFQGAGRAIGAGFEEREKETPGEDDASAGHHREVWFLERRR
jgi:hypothetical protein